MAQQQAAYVTLGCLCPRFCWPYSSSPQSLCLDLTPWNIGTSSRWGSKQKQMIVARTCQSLQTPRGI